MSEDVKRIFENTLHSIADEVLIAACKELYRWRYTSGEVLNVSQLKNILRECTRTCSANGIESEECSLRDLEPILIKEAERRFHSIVLLLIKDNPGAYFK